MAPSSELLAALEAARAAPIRPKAWRHPMAPQGRPAPRSGGTCKNDHEMTPENTGPGNVCRACKRDASRRHKERKLREQQGETDG